MTDTPKCVCPRPYIAANCPLHGAFPEPPPPTHSVDCLNGHPETCLLCRPDPAGLDFEASLDDIIDAKHDCELAMHDLTGPGERRKADRAWLEAVTRARKTHAALLAAAIAEARREEREMTERALAAWGWTNQVCPDGHVGCYLPPGHNHRSNGPLQAVSHPLPEEGT